jgi:hypothetical protein
MPICRMSGLTLIPHLEALPPQRVLKYAAARKLIIQTQFIDPGHQRQIGRRRWARQATAAYPAAPEHFSPLREGRVVAPVDNRFELSRRPACPSALGKRLLQCRLPALGVQCVHIHKRPIALLCPGQVPEVCQQLFTPDRVLFG